MAGSVSRGTPVCWSSRFRSYYTYVDVCYDFRLASFTFAASVCPIGLTVITEKLCQRIVTPRCPKL